MFPYVDVVEELISRGNQLSVKTTLLPKLEETLENANLWKEKVERVFLRRNSPFSLIEVNCN